MNRKQKDEGFGKDCIVLSMSREYPGYSGEIKWMIFSELPEEELKIRYPEQIERLQPYLYMDAEQYAPVREYSNNERKHRWRREETYERFPYEEGEIEPFHPELAASFQDPFEHEDLYEALRKLTPVQRRRVVEEYMEGRPLREIAAEEKVSFQAVAQSNAGALKTLKKLLEKE